MPLFINILLFEMHLSSACSDAIFNLTQGMLAGMLVKLGETLGGEVSGTVEDKGGGLPEKKYFSRLNDWQEE